MKHSESERAALDAALFRLNLDLNEEAKIKLLDHLYLVIEKNKEVNLTRITSFDDAVILHIEDSLSIFNTFSQTTGRFLDIGTGAGFPGIPLALCSDREGVLLDSVKKKAKAVESFVTELGLDKQVEVYGIRSEELSKLMPNSFGVVVARAVSSLPAVEEFSAPLLVKGGRLIAMRGIDSAEDIKTAKKAAKLLGLKLVDRFEFNIGGGEYSRSVCVFEKVGKSSIKLPRQCGFASKKPLV